MKTIVTHYNPDLDAITSVWLIKRYMKGWEDAEVSFVPAGETLFGDKVDSNDNVIHVDTGLGRYDHHDTDADICAAGLVWQDLKNKSEIIKAKSSASEEESLDRLVAIVNDIDHFREVYWDKPEADYHDFNLERIIDGWKILYPNENLRFLEWGMDCLDGLLQTFKNKVWAEDEIGKGVIFETKWGKGIGMETVNDEVLHLAQKKGYVIVARKDFRKGYVRIKSLPDPKIDLTRIFNEYKKKDTAATWFLHASKHMILNGSSKNPETRPTKLRLEEVINIIKNG